MTTERDTRLYQLALRHDFLDAVAAEWYLRNYHEVGEGEGLGEFLVAEKVITRKQLSVLHDALRDAPHATRDGGAQRTQRSQHTQRTQRGSVAVPLPGELAEIDGHTSASVERARVEDALERAAAQRTEPLQVEEEPGTHPALVLVASVFVVVALLFLARVLLWNE